MTGFLTPTNTGKNIKYGDGGSRTRVLAAPPHNPANTTNYPDDLFLLLQVEVSKRSPLSIKPSTTTWTIVGGFTLSCF